MFSGKPPDCVKCGFVIVIPENYEIVEIIDRYQNCFVDGMGGLNPTGIDKVLEWEDVERSVVNVQKILIYIIVSMKKQREESDHGTQNRASIRN